MAAADETEASDRGLLEIIVDAGRACFESKPFAAAWRSARRGIGVAIDVTQAFTAYSAGNRGPTPTNPDAREHPDYGLSAVLAGNLIELTLTFHTGAAYCCGEWQCHFMLFPTRRWHALRRALSDSGVEVPGQLELRVEVHIEDGALFLLPRRSAANPPGLAPSKGYRYEATVTEADRADAEPSDAVGGECM